MPKEFSVLTSDLLAKMPKFEDPRYDTVLLYLLVDPRDNTVRYVGKTEDWERRRKQHCSAKTTNLGLKAWLKDLRKAKLEPDMRIVGNASKVGWQKAERSLIAFFRAKGLLYNIHKGGAFVPSIKPPKRKSKGKKKSPSKKPKTRITSLGAHMLKRK